MTPSISLLGGRFNVQAQIPWDGRTILSGDISSPVAFDTETTLIDFEVPAHIPEMVLATACSGRHAVLVWPEQLPAFLEAHRSRHIVGHNIPFDFWVVDAWLDANGHAAAREHWRRIFDEGRAHDTMLLDQLVTLSAAPFPMPPKDHIKRRGLGDCCEAWLGKGLVDKTDPYRLRYGELLDDRSLLAKEPGFWEYALRDALATRMLWPKLLAKARSQSRKAAKLGFLDPRRAESNERLYGPLTESLQVRGACALLAAERRGMRVDIAEAASIRSLLEGRIDSSVQEIDRCFPRIFKRAGSKREDVFSDGSMQMFLPGAEPPYKLTKSGVPKTRPKEIQAALAVVSQLRSEQPILRADGSISLETEKWRARKDRHPFIEAWTSMGKDSKLLSLQHALASSAEAHPHYNPLLRTGRPSARDPNLLQCPRAKWFRKQFVARPEHLLYVVDYAAIELRVFAHLCEIMFGGSVLGKTIRDGRDPHVYTAALTMGIPYDEFKAGVKKEKEAVEVAERDGRPSPPTPLSDGRQLSKILNFGILGGLGPAKLSSYVTVGYGIPLSEQDAALSRKKIISEVYPEMEKYLRDRIVNNLAWMLGVPLEQARDSRVASRRLAKQLRGDEEPPSWLWQRLKDLANAPGSTAPADVKRRIAKAKPDADLAAWIECGPAMQPTGRIRGCCRYTVRMNTPFQGLAADGAKMALWRLLREGFVIAAFVYDEFVVELEARGAESRVKRIDEALCEEMSKVLGGFPVAVEGKLSGAWAK